MHAIVVRNDAEGLGVEWSNDGDCDVIAALMHEAPTWRTPQHIIGEMRL